MDPILIVALVFLAGMMFFNGRKRKQQAAQLAEQVVVGAKVVLNSGIIAKIVKIEDNTVVVESAGSKLEVVRSVIVRVDSAPVAEPAVSLAKSAAAKPAASKPAAAKPAAKRATATATATKPAAKKPAAKPAVK